MLRSGAKWRGMNDTTTKGHNMNAIGQINRTTSHERISQIVRDEVGSNLLDDLHARGYVTYEDLTRYLVSHERDVCRAAAARVDFLLK